MIERDVERKLKKAVEAEGGLCLKWVSPGYTGVPDRIILMAGGAVAFVETKAPGKRERPRQELVQAALRSLGFTVFSSVDGTDRIAEVVRWCKCRRADWEWSINRTDTKDT